MEDEELTLQTKYNFIYLYLMQYIGNIVTNNMIDDVDGFNVVKTIDDIIPNIPTLIIGWSIVKKNYLDVNILDGHIKDNIYWTFGKREKRIKYEEDIPKFKKFCVKELISKIKYIYFSILTESSENKRKIFNTIHDDINKTMYIDYNMAYIYNPMSNVIMGFSLRDVEYEGKNRNDFVQYLNKNNNLKIIDSKSEIAKKYRYSFKNNMYILSYICN